MGSSTVTMCWLRLTLILSMIEVSVVDFRSRSAR